MPDNRIDALKRELSICRQTINHLIEQDEKKQDALKVAIESLESKQVEIDGWRTRYNVRNEDCEILKRMLQQIKDERQAMIAELGKQIEQHKAEIEEWVVEANEWRDNFLQSREENEQLKTLYSRETERLRDQYERERGISEHLRKVMDRAYDANRSQTKAYIKLEDRYRKIKDERDQYKSALRDGMIERDEIIKTMWEVLEWYGGGSEDGGEKASDVTLRYKRGDSQ